MPRGGSAAASVAPLSLPSTPPRMCGRERRSLSPNKSILSTLSTLRASRSPGTGGPRKWRGSELPVLLPFSGALAMSL
eukprot:13321391-Heterocapsa_arctica.AAC.1